MAIMQLSLVLPNPTASLLVCELGDLFATRIVSEPKSPIRDTCTFSRLQLGNRWQRLRLSGRADDGQSCLGSEWGQDEDAVECAASLMQKSHFVLYRVCLRTAHHYPAFRKPVLERGKFLLSMTSP